MLCDCRVAVVYRVVSGVQGAIADALSPKRPDGSRSSSGLKETLFLVVLWLLWGVVFWTAAFLFARRQRAGADKKRVRSCRG